MKCSDCCYWYQWIGEDSPCCHYYRNDGDAPCERMDEDDYGERKYDE